MDSHIINKLKLYRIILHTFLLIGYLSAQTFYIDDFSYTKPKTSLRFLHPTFEDHDPSFLSGLYDCYLNTPIISQFNIILDVPFIVESSDFKIGNVFIGIQKTSDLQEKTVQSDALGIFLPTAVGDNDNFYTNIKSNFFEYQRYIPNSLTIYLSHIHSFTISSSSHFGFEAAPNFLFFTKDPYGNVGQFSINYGIFVDSNLHNFVFRCELIGSRAIPSDSDQRYNHSMIFGLSYKILDIFYNRPLSNQEYNLKLKNVFGIRMSLFLESN